MHTGCSQEAWCNSWTPGTVDVKRLAQLKQPVSAHMCVHTGKTLMYLNCCSSLTLASLYTSAFLSSCIFYTCFVPGLCSGAQSRQSAQSAVWWTMPRGVKNSKATFQCLGLMSRVFLGSFPEIAEGIMNHYKILEKNYIACCDASKTESMSSLYT